MIGPELAGELVRAFVGARFSGDQRHRRRLVQITCEDAADLPVPGQTYTFGVVKAAQARGDFQVLAERGRRALRVHLGKDVSAGLAMLRVAIDRALR